MTTPSNWLRPSTRLAIYMRDRFTCVYCSRPDLTQRSLTVDHVRPRSKGGTNNPSNLVTACVQCNSAKGNLRVHDFEPGAKRAVRNARRRTLPRRVARALCT